MRGNMRSRPPQVIRNSMTELGQGSLAKFDALAKSYASANADAARAFFPVLPEGKRQTAGKLMESERELVRLASEVRRAMWQSPVAVTGGRRAMEGGEKSVMEYGRYFAGGGREEGEEGEGEGIWEGGWVVEEVLPAEILGGKRRGGKRARIGGRVEGEEEGVGVGVGDEVVGEGGDKEEGEEGEEGGGEGERLDEEDDLELDADYQTGVRFDDDDGYEENDSGAEEATF